MGAGVNRHARRGRRRAPVCDRSQHALCDSACACRYHYNVSTDRLLSHVKKGWDQGLFISSATSNADLWALVMDEATGYSTQSYKVCDAFLPKTWCMAQWDAGMYITAVAGALSVWGGSRPRSRARPGHGCRLHTSLSRGTKIRHACKCVHAGSCTR